MARAVLTGIVPEEIRISVLALFACLVTGCANYGSVDGVDNLWREVPISDFDVGKTTQSEVLEKLGPPSQLINLESEVVFYYLARRRTGKGMIFIVWNDVKEVNRYDRAIFFFDREGLLTNVAYSDEAIAR